MENSDQNEDSEEEEGDDDDGENFDSSEQPQTFTDLHLSRVILKACTALGYENPTPIQQRCIPYALSGKDICGSAHTGSGKLKFYIFPSKISMLMLKK